jgi:hypothetical protein
MKSKIQIYIAFHKHDEIYGWGAVIYHPASDTRRFLANKTNQARLLLHDAVLACLEAITKPTEIFIWHQDTTFFGLKDEVEQRFVRTMNKYRTLVQQHEVSFSSLNLWGKSKWVETAYNLATIASENDEVIDHRSNGCDCGMCHRYERPLYER